MLIKMGMSENREDTVMEMIKHRSLSLPIIAGIMCFIFALVAYSYVLSRMKLNMAYPIMTSSGFVLIGISSWLFFRETVTTTQVIGFVLMILGIFLVAR